MMKLKSIKSKKGNEQYNELILNTTKLINSALNISDNEYLFFLTWFRFRMIFLYKDTIIIVLPKFNFDNDSSVRLTELYTVKLLKDYPKTSSDIEIKTIIKGDSDWFTNEIFLNWIDEPSEINEEIDEPYYKIISYLQKYNKNTFSTDRYIFYSKRDNDQNFILNIYAFDKKNNVEMKLYIPDRFEKVNGEWVYLAPKKVVDIAIEDLSGELSNYQKLQCKKAFLEIANKENEYFKSKNFWVMELVKLTIQPVDILHEWSCHRCFNKTDLFCEIWVKDYLNNNEEPYFFITDSNLLQDTTKVAAIDFKTPTYHEKRIYKRNNLKRKGWKLTENQIKKLIEFLNSPSNRSDDYCNGMLQKAYKKYVKTNWQQLIFEYNHNTAGWDIDEPINFNTKNKIEQLPFDLTMPDYTELLNDKR